MKTSVVTISVAAAVVLVVAFEFQAGDGRAMAAGATSSPLTITLDAGGSISPDGQGAYVNGVSGVTATYTASTGTISFANAAPGKGKTGRIINLDLNDPADAGDPPLGVRQVFMASWMKPIDNADGFYDMRAMKISDTTRRKWNVQWPGSNNTVDACHLHWDPPLFPSDAEIELTCVAQVEAGPCTTWEARPAGPAGLRHIWRMAKNVPYWQDDGYYNVPFIMTIHQ